MNETMVSLTNERLRLLEQKAESFPWGCLVDLERPGVFAREIKPALKRLGVDFYYLPFLTFGKAVYMFRSEADRQAFRKTRW